ncbi:MAG: glycosyltransferase family 2 protein [Solirubrobacterales bacterium]
MTHDADWTLATPVALLIFNRPEVTERVFEEIRRARPPKLLVVADGPRADRAGEAERCAATRAIAEGVDWPCELLREYSDVNLGCRRRVSTGLDWVFDSVERAIVLEDDCLPHPTFFRFCEQLLDRYADDERVMHLSGDNFQFGQRRGDASYYFSRYAHVWGWASWRRAWAHYDVDMAGWREADKDAQLERFTDPLERSFWRHVWDGTEAGAIDTWDLQWAYACLMRGGVAVNPNVNLVSNIGFGAASTHTGSDEGGVASLPTEAISFPLAHPATVAVDAEADRQVAGIFFRDRAMPVPSRSRGVLARLMGLASRIGTVPR